MTNRQLSTETDRIEAPNWLSELEAKREKRVIAKLGHEAGAGAPCLNCEQKCPGLDLHFWRKICKNCKCSKENHDVHDDDIYGWAQFQLLGNKPNKIKRKIVLPGKKDEVELDWAPRGQNDDTIEQYLRTIPPELLPVKGSQAAKERKQMLQKQIPIHDIDPTLCHELSDAELKQMHDYIDYMKANSVGVGHVIQTKRVPKNLASIEAVVQRLPRQMQDLRVATNDTNNYEQQQVLLDDFFDVIPKPSNLIDNLNNVMVMPHYAPGKLNIYSDNQMPNAKVIGNIKDLAFSTYDPELLKQKQQQQPNYNYHATNSNNNNMNSNNNSPTSLKSLNPNQQFHVPVDNLVPQSIQIGSVRDIDYDPTDLPLEHDLPTTKTIDTPTPIDKTLTLPQQQQLPHCHRCTKQFADNEFAIHVERANSLFHSDCFKCAGCNQNLADMVYFYDKESNNIYCGRDFAKIRGIPRCGACDELIFVKEYCLADNVTYHVKHFCCFECDRALAGENYVIEEGQQTLCLPCFEHIKASQCNWCLNVIKPDEQGVNLNGTHYHASERCFGCRVCRRSLLGEKKMLFRNQQLFCSHNCFQQSQ